jgi:divinyl chlorophyllide a 8-vinyl-reductase
MSLRVFVLGATGTIGRAAVAALLEDGHEVVCLVRAKAGVGGGLTPDASARLLEGAQLRLGDVRDPQSLARDGFRGEHFDVLLSCLASRTGAPADAWAIDHQAHSRALEAARQAGVQHMVLLSALCVQKPRLAFQQAKLAFERELIESGLNYSIVRPTAFFKSISGQFERVRQGKPYLMFGNGELTACKPISDRDLGRYLAQCITDATLHRRILPIGGPGPALTPRQQGQMLFAALGRTPRFKQVPVALLDVIVGVLGAAGRLIPPLRDKAELAKIGRYYATESMLLWDAKAQRYDAQATPSHGTQTLFEAYARWLKGDGVPDRGDHAVF